MEFVSGGPRERLICEHDPGTGQIDRLGFGNEHGIVRVNDDGFEEAQTFFARVVAQQRGGAKLAQFVELELICDLRSKGREDVFVRAAERPWIVAANR